MAETIQPSGRYENRRNLVRKAKELIESSVVLIGSNETESEDYERAAQAIIINELQSRFFNQFESPALPQSDDFFADFYSAYDVATLDVGSKIWHELEDDMMTSLQQKVNEQQVLTELEAAYVTLVASQNEIELITNREVPIFLALFARAYHELLREKFGKDYTETTFLKELRTNMPDFLKKYIAMPGRIGQIATNSLVRGEQAEAGEDVYNSKTRFDVRLLELNDINRLKFKSEYLRIVKKYIEDKNIQTDLLGREADRGCTFLISDDPQKMIDFIVFEFVKQYKARFGI